MYAGVVGILVLTLSCALLLAAREFRGSGALAASSANSLVSVASTLVWSRNWSAILSACPGDGTYSGAQPARRPDDAARRNTTATRAGCALEGAEFSALVERLKNEKGLMYERPRIYVYEEWNEPTVLGAPVGACKQVRATSCDHDVVMVLLGM